MAAYLPRKPIIFEFQRGQSPRWNRFSEVIDHAEIVCKKLLPWPASITSQTCNELRNGPHWNRFWRILKRLSQWIRSHMRNGFNPWIRALVGVDWWKKRGSKISCNRPFNKKNIVPWHSFEVTNFAAKVIRHALYNTHGVTKLLSRSVNSSPKRLY
jgi:hypothetical protein